MWHDREEVESARTSFPPTPAIISSDSEDLHPLVTRRGFFKKT